MRKSPEQLSASWRLGTFLALAAFALLLGGALRQGPLLALGEALLLLLAMSWASCRLALRGLTCERVLVDRAFEDDEVEVAITLRQGLWTSAGAVEVGDHCPATALGNRTVLFPAIPRGEAEVRRYRVRCDQGRGAFRLGPLTLVASDPLGLLRLERPLFPVEGATLVVYPRPLAAAELELSAPLWCPSAGEEVSGRAGHASEFLGLREHRPGEPLRRVHWRASARRDRLLLAEFEEASRSSVTVFLDLSLGGLQGVGRGSSAERGIRAAATVATQAAERGHAVGLIADGGEPLAITARGGRSQALVLLEALARTRARGGTDLVELLERGSALVPAGGRVVVVAAAPRVDEQRLAGVVARWRRDGKQPLAVLVDEGRYLERGTAPPARAGTAPLPDVLERLGVPVRRLAPEAAAPAGEVA